jgi:hypothetical protein
MSKIKRNKSVKDELVALRLVESRLLKVEQERRKIEKQLLSEIRASRSSFLEKHGLRKYLFKYLRARLMRQKFLYSVIIAVAVVMVWSGAWAIIEHYIPNPWLAFSGGVLLLWLVRYYMH